jgi:signal peptidase I
MSSTAPYDGTARHKPWLAVLMSLVLPGFGQLYNGEINKALWTFICFVLLTIPFGAMLALYGPESMLVAGLALATLAGLALWLWAMTDAWRTAARTNSSHPQPWQTSGLYLATLVVSAFLVLPFTYSYVRGHLAEPFQVPSSSMTPTILPGDFIFADKRYNCPGCKHAVRRGDIALFVYPNDRTKYYIKRIIGLPGDRVEMRGREVLLNGKSLLAQEIPKAEGVDVIEETDIEHAGKRRWTVHWDGPSEAFANAVVTVPPGHVLVLGDHRNASSDSRAFGTVPLHDVVGRARQIWMSWNHGVRWDRLGRVLQ